MVNVARLVEEYLNQDGIAKVALERGIVNHRALAKWMINERGLAASEGAVISAVRRHVGPSDSEKTIFEPARMVLRGAHIHMRSRIAILVLNKNRSVQMRLPALFDAVDYTRGEVLRIAQTTRCIKVIVDETNLTRVEEIVGRDAIQERMTGLAELNVVPSDTTRKTPGVLALVLLTLALNKINLLEVATGIPEHLIFIDQKESLKAYEVLRSLTAKSTARRDPTILSPLTEQEGPRS